MPEPATAPAADAPATEDAPEGAGSPKPDAGAPTFPLLPRSLSHPPPCAAVTDLIKSTFEVAVSARAFSVTGRVLIACAPGYARGSASGSQLAALQREDLRGAWAVSESAATADGPVAHGFGGAGIRISSKASTIWGSRSRPRSRSAHCPSCCRIRESFLSVANVSAVLQNNPYPFGEHLPDL